MTETVSHLAYFHITIEDIVEPYHSSRKIMEVFAYIFNIIDNIQVK